MNKLVLIVILDKVMVVLTSEKFMTFMIQTVRARLTIMMASSRSRKKYMHLFLQPYRPTGYAVLQPGRWTCKDWGVRINCSWVICKKIRNYSPKQTHTERGFESCNIKLCNIKSLNAMY